MQFFLGFNNTLNPKSYVLRNLFFFSRQKNFIPFFCVASSSLSRFVSASSIFSRHLVLKGATKHTHSFFFFFGDDDDDANHLDTKETRFVSSSSSCCRSLLDLLLLVDDDARACCCSSFRAPVRERERNTTTTLAFPKSIREIPQKKRDHHHSTRRDTVERAHFFETRV